MVCFDDFFKNIKPLFFSTSVCRFQFLIFPFLRLAVIFEQPIILDPVLDFVFLFSPVDVPSPFCVFRV